MRSCRSSVRAPKTPDADARPAIVVPNSVPRPSHALAVEASSVPMLLGSSGFRAESAGPMILVRVPMLSRS